MTLQINDKVKTIASWDDHGEPISGIVKGFETLKYNKTIPVQNPKTGLIWERIVPNQYNYTEVVVLDNGEKIHDSNLEKVD